MESGPGRHMDINLNLTQYSNMLIRVASNYKNCSRDKQTTCLSELVMTKKLLIIINTLTIEIDVANAKYLTKR